MTWAILAPILSSAAALFGLIVALFKAGANSRDAASEATKTAVDVFQASITQLRTDLADARTEAHGLTKALRAADAERAKLRGEVASLQARVSELERR